MVLNEKSDWPPAKVGSRWRWQCSRHGRPLRVLLGGWRFGDMTIPAGTAAGLEAAIGPALVLISHNHQVLALRFPASLA
ncbi:hypothetical protein [Mesorhizobium australicum]|uniref:hypothetical protein n=1 Tax=Mesorhizobium australicum TaxID=536018 RepID=UPI00333BE31E